MPSASRIFGYGIVAIALTAFVVWVLYEMAYADESLWRLAKIGMGMGAVLLAACIYGLSVLARRRGPR